MQQILFHIPLTQGWFGMPDGVPLYGFGAMLFLCFVLTAMVWGPKRVQPIGMPKERVQDLAIILFVTGIAGARIVYMIQYADQFKGKNLFVEFFKIWEGGIVFYGSAIGGVIGFLLFRHFVLKKLGISIWKLGDAVAPCVALGLAVGRIGCYLNGCCWGQVAVPEVQPVPLAAEMGQFPLLTSHARDQVTKPAEDGQALPRVRGVQTGTGFTVDLEKAVVERVEKGSQAEGVLQSGDRIVGVNGTPIFQLAVHGPSEALPTLRTLLEGTPGRDLGIHDGELRFGYPTRAEAAAAETAAESSLRSILIVTAPESSDLQQGRKALADTQGEVLTEWPKGVVLRYRSTGEMGAAEYALQDAKSKSKLSRPTVSIINSLETVMADWPRWRKSLDLEVDRAGETKTLSFSPRTVTFFPTQLYEVVSMVLLILLLLAFQPFRRHDGQVLVLLMLGYGVHRWFNEAIRIEPTYALGMTLSQWISVGIVVAAIGLEIFLRKTQPRLPKPPVPLGYGCTPYVPPPKPT